MVTLMPEPTTNPLDVLVVESHQGAANEAEAVLLAAGHRVHRCYGPDDVGFPCTAITDRGSCPIDGGVDVALLVRRQVLPRATSLEVGVTCAIRAGIPVAESGPDTLDPYEPWLTVRSDGDDIVADVVATAQRGLDPLREDIRGRAATVLPEGSDPEAIACRFERHGPELLVHLSGPRLHDEVTQAMAVRALDAVGRSGRTFTQVDVTYHPT